MPEAERRFLDEGIETLKRFDARIYRTDETGAASADTDGSEITVRAIL